MFVHHLKYALKTMLRNKTALVWTLLFPVALGTFMYLGFGNITEEFEVIPVAVVEVSENEAFETVLETWSEEGKSQLLEVTYTSEEEAKEAVAEEDVVGIIYVDKELRLEITSNSYESTILKTILDAYKKQGHVVADVISRAQSPAEVERILESASEQKNYLSEKSTSDGNQNLYTNYFYAIFAMSCLFASFGALEKIAAMQANVSALGMRRCVSPGSKACSVTAEFLSMLIVQVVIELLVLLYFVCIGVDFGSRYLPICGILVLGSAIGISIGIIFGSISKLSENTKSGLCILTGMALSVMADLVAVGIKDMIEHTIPIINRINPAALIVDSFYALNVYDTYERYLTNIATLGALTAVLLVISFLILRRNRYASV